MRIKSVKVAFLSTLVIVSIVALATWLLSTSPVHAALALHTPISIDGNDNFASTNGVVGIQGTENILEFDANGKIYRGHRLTSNEIVEAKRNIGVRDPTENYNKLVDGHGTGLAPPTEEEWDSMVGTIVIDSECASAGTSVLSTSKRLDLEPYFPPIGNQDGQNSCTAWATGYYNNGYLQAKIHGWTNLGGDQSHLMSPAWVYNKANQGNDSGSAFSTCMGVVDTVGEPSLSKMPFNSSDYLSWGSESAWREAPLYRTQSMLIDNVTNIDVIKSWLNDGYPVNFGLYCNDMNGNGFNGTGFSWGVNIISYNKYKNNIADNLNYYTGHAQTIVGYDDSIAYDGDVGAFRVVNSWGTSWGDSGYYWITYHAMDEIYASGYWWAYRYTLKNENWSVYNPTILAVWGLNPAGTREAYIELGVGDPGSPLDMRIPELYGGSVQSFPNFMCLDVSEFKDEIENGNNYIYLKIGDANTPSTIASFRVEVYENYNAGRYIEISSESPNVPATSPTTVYNRLLGRTIAWYNAGDWRAGNYENARVWDNGTIDIGIYPPDPNFDDNGWSFSSSWISNPSHLYAENLAQIQGGRAYFHALLRGNVLTTDSGSAEAFASNTYYIDNAGIINENMNLNFWWRGESNNFDDSPGYTELSIWLGRPDSSWVRLWDSISQENRFYAKKPFRPIAIENNATVPIPAGFLNTSGYYTIEILVYWNLHPVRGSDVEYFNWYVDNVSFGLKGARHTTEWRDIGLRSVWKTLEASTIIGPGENINALIEVSDDGINVKDNKELILNNGKNAYDITSLKSARYARVITSLITDDVGHTPSLDEYAITANPLPSLSLSPNYLNGSPMATLTYNINLTNNLNGYCSYNLAVSDNSGWVAVLNSNSIENVGPGENRQTTLSLTIPDNAIVGTIDNITLTAASQTDNTVSASASCTAQVVIIRGVSVSLSPITQSGANNATLTYTVTVSNTGNVSDNYSLTSSDTTGWSPSVLPKSVVVPAFSSDNTTTLSVTIPSGAIGGTTDNITVTATSQTDNKVNGSGSCTAQPTIFSITLRLVAGWNLLCFPVDNSPTTPNRIFTGLTYFTDYIIYWWTAPGGPYNVQNPDAALLDNLGYWVYINKDCTVTYTGTQHVNRDVHLITGWNMVGFPVVNSSTTPDNKFAPESYFTDFIIYWWTAPGGPYNVQDPSTVLNDNTGYLVWIDQDWTVTVP